LIEEKLTQLALVVHQQQFVTPRKGGNTEISPVTNPTGLGSSANSYSPPQAPSDSSPRVSFSEDSKTHDGTVTSQNIVEPSIVETPSVANASTDANATIISSVATDGSYLSFNGSSV